MSTASFTLVALRAILLALAPVLALCMPGRAAAEGAAYDRIELRVLYAGNPGSERMADFEALLKKHFASVGMSDYTSFKPEDAKDFDVVLFDWTSIYPRDENGKMKIEGEPDIEQPQAPELGADFDRPAVLIGAAGGGIANRLQIAINWKCLCLENDAHDVETDHAIFQGPLPVELEFHDREKPADYFLAPGTKELGETIPVWTVHEKTFPEIDPGLVSTRESFVNTPDAEAIAGGINGKGPTSVAIGRHGNYLLWGFAGQPSEMTESGRNAFVNAVCYIDKFDGHKPGVVKSTYGDRDSFLEQVYFLRSVSDDYVAAQVKKLEQMMKDYPMPAEALKQVGDDPAAYFRNMMAPHAKLTLEKLPQDVRDLCSDDAEQLIAYYDENVEYLRTDGQGGFMIDDDAKQLGVSNRSPELLEKCISLLEAGQDVELATRVLQRYTGQDLDDAATWREWFQTAGEPLHFDEGSGAFIPARVFDPAN